RSVVPSAEVHWRGRSAVLPASPGEWMDRCQLDSGARCPSRHRALRSDGDRRDNRRGSPGTANVPPDLPGNRNLQRPQYAPGGIGDSGQRACERDDSISAEVQISSKGVCHRKLGLVMVSTAQVISEMARTGKNTSAIMHLRYWPASAAAMNATAVACTLL